MASVPVFCRDFWAERKKAPEGGCSPGKKGLMILYLFALVGDVLDLNCNCSIAALISGFDNDSNLCPIAFKFHAVVGIFDLSNFFSDLINQICYKTSSLVVCIHSKCCVLLIRTNIGVNIKHKGSRKAGINLCIKVGLSGFIELTTLVIPDSAICITQTYSIRIFAELLPDIIFQRSFRGCAASGGEHHHSHHTCQQQGYKFFQVFHKGIPPISVFCGYVSFFSKGFRNHRCLSALIISDA